MKQSLLNNLIAAKRLLCVSLAILLSVAALPLFSMGSASAVQVIDRSITMSDSGPSGGAITTGVGSGEAVTYRVSFTAAAATAQSLVVDFCSESPLIGSTCTVPTDFDSTGAGLVGVTGAVNATDWTLTATTNGSLQFASDGDPGHEIVPGTVTFEVTGITNPSTLGTYYARFYTFSNASFGTYTNAGAPGNYVDFGGIALTTVETIQITARVQEQLTFCLTTANHSTWNSNHDCSDPVVAGAPPSLILGHGSPVELLDAVTVDTGSIYSQVSTNATSGVVVKMRNSNTACGGLSSDGGATCSIPAHNSGSGAGASALSQGSTSGTAAFGMFASAGALGDGGVGTMTPAAAYHDASHTTVPSDVWYGMDTTTADNNVISAYGSTVCSAAGPVYRAENVFTFAATAALTTPAGIYTANLSMIATGTF